MNQPASMTAQQAQNDFEATFNRAINGETVLIKQDSGHEVVLMGLAQYNAMLERIKAA